MSNTKNLANLAAVLDDGTSGQVLQSTGSGGVQFADSTGSGVTVHANQAAMLTDAASSSEGSLHYETGTNKLYVKQSSGFYLLASITNVAPTIDSFSEATGGASANNLTAGGTFTLTSGSNTVITINATEPDLETISYSATVTSGTATDVFSSPSFPVSNQSSNVFTLTPVTSGTGGTVTIRFDASDGTNVANVSHSFEIAFVIADSHYTTLLMATDGSAGNNKDDISDATGSHTITPYGDVHAGTFSPYRHGGYSTYFDGNGDYLTISNDTSLNLANTSFTIECWVFPVLDYSNYRTIFSKRVSGSTTTSYHGYLANSTGYISFYNGTNYESSTVLASNAWSHCAWVYDGTNIKIFVNGTQVFSQTVSISEIDEPLSIGFTRGTTEIFGGYISDFRIVKGTALYTSNFTPTSTRLSTVSGTGYSTSLLTCHLPYIADGSSNNHSITVNGDPETKPFGPYDYSEYSESDNGGSLYFDGSDYIDTNTAINFSSGGCIEGWVYITTASNFAFFIASEQGTTSYPRWYVGHSNVTDWRCSPGDSTDNNITSYDLVKNQWNHFVLSNDGSTSRFFANGVLIFTKSVTPVNETLEFNFSKYGDTANYYMTGHLSDIRIDTTIPTAYQTSSTTIGTFVFTPPAEPLSSTGADFHMKGTDAHVIDKSQVSNLKLVGTAAAVTNAPNNSNISSTNAVSFDGNSDYVLVPYESIPSFGAGEFTIEGWIYMNNLTGNQIIIDKYASGNSQSFQLYYRSTGTSLTFYVGSSVLLQDPSSSTISAQTWHHIAVTRDGSNNVRLYVDGLKKAQSTSSVNFDSSINLHLGVQGSTSTNYFNGYMQDVRLSNKAFYTADDESSNIPSSPLKG